jgi:hypothetical protein
LVGHYVAGYHAANPLTSKEMDAVAPAILAAEITSTTWSYLIASGQLDRNPAGQVDGFRVGSRSMAWLSTHLDELDATIQQLSAGTT